MVASFKKLSKISVEVTYLDPKSLKINLPNAQTYNKC